MDGHIGNTGEVEEGCLLGIPGGKGGGCFLNDEG